MHHRKMYMYINFHKKNALVDQLKPCTQIYWKKIAIRIFKKITTFGHALPSTGHSGRF